jgi:uncharacterized protein YciI
MKLKIISLLVIMFSIFFLGETTMAQDNRPPILFVIFHSPGPKWDFLKSFREQTNIMEHVMYFSKFDEEKKLVLGGPFLDNSGGMAVLKVSSQEEAQKIAQEDPTVVSGLLIATVKPWMAAMGSPEILNQ